MNAWCIESPCMLIIEKRETAVEERQIEDAQNEFMHREKVQKNEEKRCTIERCIDEGGLAFHSRLSSPSCSRVFHLSPHHTRNNGHYKREKSEQKCIYVQVKNIETTTLIIEWEWVRLRETKTERQGGFAEKRKKWYLFLTSAFKIYITTELACTSKNDCFREICQGWDDKNRFWFSSHLSFNWLW